MRIYSLKFEGANQVVIFVLAKLCLATLILVSVFVTKCSRDSHFGKAESNI